jgi:hypothetical protein
MADVVGMYRAAGVTLRAPAAGDWVTCRCFAGIHDDRHPSARINLRSGGFRCFTCGAKGGAIAALVLLGVDHRRAVELAVDYGVVDPEPAPRRRHGPWEFLTPPMATIGANGNAAVAVSQDPSTVPSNPTTAVIDWGALAAEMTVAPARERTWVYVDDHDTPVGRVHRIDLADGSKRVFQERPDGNGWKPGLDGTHFPLYRFPELLRHARAGDRVLVVEGEKCCDALDRLGVFATTNAGGSGKWRSDLTRPLRGATVTVVADCDWPGRCHAVDVTRALADGHVQATMPLDLDPGRGDGYDVVDDLAELAATVRAVEPGIDAGELRWRLRRNLLDRVTAMLPVDDDQLARYAERARQTAGENPGHAADAMLRCIRCGQLRPHRIRMGLAYCACGAPPTLAPNGTA